MVHLLFLHAEIPSHVDFPHVTLSRFSVRPDIPVQWRVQLYQKLLPLRRLSFCQESRIFHSQVLSHIDANGILKVSAKDKATGKEQAIRIEASSGLSKEEIEKMKAEAEANAEADKKEREKIDKLNQADSMIFSTENQLKELGDKLSADKKAPIETALQKLKDAHKAQDLAAIDTAMAELNTAFQAASAEMYAQSGAQGGAQAGPGAGTGQQANQGSSSNNKEDIQDADFEEVK